MGSWGLRSPSGVLYPPRLNVTGHQAAGAVNVREADVRRGGSRHLHRGRLLVKQAGGLLPLGYNLG